MKRFAEDANKRVFESDSTDGDFKKIIIFSVTSMSTDISPHTNLLVTKMNNVAQKRKLNVTVQMHSVSKIKDKVKDTDIIVLSPELSSERENIQKEFPYKAVKVINKRDYGLLNAEKILEDILLN